MSNYQTILIFSAINVGIIKSLLNYLGIYVDVTIIVSIILFSDILFDITLKNGSKQGIMFFNSLLFIYVFSSVILISLFYSSSSDYKFEKLLPYVNSLVFLLYPFFVRKLNLNLLLKLYTFIIIPIALFFAYYRALLFQSDDFIENAFYQYRNLYLLIGYNVGCAFLIAIYLKKYYVSFLILIVLLALGARGPLIFSFLIGLGYLIFSLKRKAILFYFSYSLILLLGVILFINYFQLGHIFDVALSRLFSITQDDQSLGSRFSMFEYAFITPFDNLSSFLFGFGFGSFGQKYFSMDIKAYPHNLFLELFFELGSLGLLIFTIFFFGSFFLFKNKISFKNDSNLFFVLFIFAFFNSLKTNSFVEIWSFYFFFNMYFSANKSNKIKIISV